MSKVLVVVAHCDDELLGCGCYIDRLIASGNEVNICCMTYYSPTREEDIHKIMTEMHIGLGITRTYIAPFVASSSEGMHLDKVKFVETAILETGCDTIITHSRFDLHKDHVETHDIAMEAVRLYQRFPNDYAKNHIRKVLEMEIPCASLWGEDRFNPNMFIETDENTINKKVDLVSRYKDVIRKYPHPRSIENIKALARVRGAMCGCEFAEAFRIVFEKG